MRATTNETLNPPFFLAERKAGKVCKGTRLVRPTALIVLVLTVLIFSNPVNAQTRLTLSSAPGGLILGGTAQAATAALGTVNALGIGVGVYRRLRAGPPAGEFRRRVYVPRGNRLPGQGRRPASVLPAQPQEPLAGAETRPAAQSAFAGPAALYLQDPVSFAQSSNLPPEVKALLDAQVPINTSVSALGQFRFGNKLGFNPNVSFARSDSGRTESWTPFAGYSLLYQAARTLQLTSGLTNVWVFSDAQKNVQRSTIFYFGVIKSFSALPVSSLASHGRVIEGRVFRDNNVNGVFNAGERGYEGVRVDMESGESAVTDEQGRFRFAGVSGGEHSLSLDLTQFRGPVRMTTRNRANVDLIRERIAIVNFGVVDFARLMGNMFNDLRFDGKRQPDAKGMPGIRLVLDGGDQARRIITAEGTGDYELDDVPPGDYTLTVDANSIPANYVLPAESFPIHVAPVSTVVLDVPTRAPRSIAGRVFLRVAAGNNDKGLPPADPGKLKISGMPQANANGQRGQQAGGRRSQAGGQQNAPAAEPEFTLIPLAGVQLTAGSGVAKSDENGNFLLRDLPAGELTMTLVPLQSLPEGMKVPRGIVRMPAEPVQVQGATIVISNPDLVPYLVGKTAGQVRDAAKPEVKTGARAVTPATGPEPASPGGRPATADKTKPSSGTM